MTWYAYADRLTPEQVTFLLCCDARPDHLSGEDAHRRGMIRLAQMYGAMGPGGLN